LHHNDRPELYHNLPKEPAIDTSINIYIYIMDLKEEEGFH